MVEPVTPPLVGLADRVKSTSPEGGPQVELVRQLQAENAQLRQALESLKAAYDEKTNELIQMYREQLGEDAV